MSRQVYSSRITCFACFLAVQKVEQALTEALSNLETHLLLEQIDALVSAAGVEGTQEILNAFWRSTSDLLDALDGQIDKGDLSGAAATAHAVKGSAANIGAHKLSTTASAIEEACKSGENANLGAQLSDLKSDYETAQVCFEHHLAQAS